MRLVMTLLVRDEEDILAANLDYHHSQGVDFFLVMDNLSVDRTATIARDYERRGLARYIHQPRDDYSQSEWVTQMARAACVEHQADWVINNDADEFWWPLQGDLRTTFAAIDPVADELIAERHNFVAVADETAPFHQRMVYRQAVSLNASGRPLPPKVAHRAAPEVRVAQGNHAVTAAGRGRRCSGPIEILHFPVRRYAQVLNKIAKGGAAYARNATLPPAVGATWRELYQRLQREQGLAGFYADEVHDEARLRERVARGELIEDRRLQQFLARIGSDGTADRSI